MDNIETREQNLFNATDTMAQFYYEIESFLDILYGNMERAGFAAKAERLRSGTFTTKNLTRRLLATATVVYVKDIGPVDDVLDEDEAEDEEDGDASKTAKKEVPITDGFRMPFVQIARFRSRTIPSVRTLTSPMLYYGAAGEMKFVDKKSGNVSLPDSPVLSMSNLANIVLGPSPRKGGVVRIPCWNPSRMKKYKMEATLVGFESCRLLEIDSQEKISEIADALNGFCGPANNT